MHCAIALAILFPCAAAQADGHAVEDLVQGALHGIDGMEHSLSHGLDREAAREQQIGDGLEREAAKEQQIMHQTMKNPMKAMSKLGVNVTYKSENITFGSGGKVHEKETSCVDGKCKTRDRSGHIVQDDPTKEPDKHAEERKVRAEKAERLRQARIEQAAQAKAKAEAEARAEEAKAEATTKREATRERTAKAQAALDAKKEQEAKMEATKAALAANAVKDSLAKAEQEANAQEDAHRAVPHHHSQIAPSAPGAQKTPSLRTCKDWMSYEVHGALTLSAKHTGHLDLVPGPWTCYVPDSMRLGLTGELKDSKLHLHLTHKAPPHRGEVAEFCSGMTLSKTGQHGTGEDSTKPPAQEQLLGTWVGSYSCYDEQTDLDLHIEPDVHDSEWGWAMVPKNGDKLHVRGTFKFANKVEKKAVERMEMQKQMQKQLTQSQDSPDQETEQAKKHSQKKEGEDSWSSQHPAESRQRQWRSVDDALAAKAPTDSMSIPAVALVFLLVSSGAAFAMRRLLRSTSVVESEGEYVYLSA